VDSSLIRRLLRPGRDAEEQIALIVGLGNPGPEYVSNRHNVGFQTLDLLAARHGLRFDQRQHHARLTRGQIAGHPVLLAKPLTYMNLSGRAVSAVVSRRKVDVSRLLVVLDDLDLALGVLRLRPSGGHGGQKGLRSIIQSLGTNDFARLRMGIGRPPGRMDPAAYVLRDFTRAEEPEAAVMRERAAGAIEAWLLEGIDKAMNRFNG